MIQQYTFNGQGRQIDAKGTFFRYESGVDGGSVTALQLWIDGNNVGTFEPGDAMDLPDAVKRWEIKPVSGGCTGVVKIGMGRITSGRFTATGMLTNAELRASAVPVTGPLTQAQLSATMLGTTQPVSGPLTDAQLRASAVPVTGPLTQAQLSATMLATTQPVDLMQADVDAIRRPEVATGWSTTNAALVANTAVQLVAPASNVGGMLVLSASVFDNDAGASIFLLAKASAPASVTDGMPVFHAGITVNVASTAYMNGCVFVPAGMGLYWIANGPTAAQPYNYRTVCWRLL